MDPMDITVLRFFFLPCLPHSEIALYVLLSLATAGFGTYQSESEGGALRGLFSGRLILHPGGGGRLRPQIRLFS